jgi:uncharacterized protein (TIGR02270 family)
VNTPALRRSNGFAPREISERVNLDIVSQHAEEAAFLWTQRRRAVTEPHYSLKDLERLDERVEAHLDGLKVARDVGWDFCKANLAQEGPGEEFALAVLAFDAGNRDRMREAVTAACVNPKLWPGLISALGWLEYADVSGWLERLLGATAPMYRTLGIAGCAVHRQDPGIALAEGMDDVDTGLRARALRCAGEIKRLDLLDTARIHLKDEDEVCRFWAAWTVTLLGGSEGVPILIRCVEQNNEYSERALQLALRALGVIEGRRWISSLASGPQFARFVVLGAGIVGDPVSVPWLIRKMESPEFARLAGEAFTMITGVDLAFQDLSQDSPPESETGLDGVTVDDIVPLDYESNLPWPSPSLVADWWGKHRHSFTDGTRHLGGQPIAMDSMVRILAGGKQRLRAAAALELALINRQYVLFNVHARGSRQHKSLGKWIS